MLLYHRTDAASEILRHGFRDSQGSYGMDGLSDYPLDAQVMGGSQARGTKA